jgi:hypothetical protein
MHHSRIERLMRGVVSKSGEHSKHFGRLRLTPWGVGTSAESLRRYCVQPNFGLVHFPKVASKVSD